MEQILHAEFIELQNVFAKYVKFYNATEKIKHNQSEPETSQNYNIVIFISFE